MAEHLGGSRGRNDNNNATNSPGMGKTQGEAAAPGDDACSTHECGLRPERMRQPLGGHRNGMDGPRNPAAIVVVLLWIPRAPTAPAVAVLPLLGHAACPCGFRVPASPPPLGVDPNRAALDPPLETLCQSLARESPTGSYWIRRRTAGRPSRHSQGRRNVRPARRWRRGHRRDARAPAQRTPGARWRQIPSGEGKVADVRAQARGTWAHAYWMACESIFLQRVANVHARPACA